MLAGNWKMFGTRSEATALARALVQSVGQTVGREVVIAPPYTALEAVADVIKGSAIRLSAQNVHWEPKGAYTGDVSCAMLREAHCTHVIIGHSERRQYAAETDETVNLKLHAAVAAGFTPIVCVGETLSERDAGTTVSVIRRQVGGAFAGMGAAEFSKSVVAYEPIWAIGTGRTATPAQAEEVHAAIRKLMSDLVGNTVAATVRILYGGSVKPDNVDALMAEPDIDGALVGGASLDAASFTRIVQFQEKH
jgi:triosephosphate isomerase